jgi:hypothetical protein
MDATLYDDTIENPMEPKPFVDKDMLYVLDQNGGSYNGQITFDTSSLSNSGRWQSFSEGYIQIPFVITASNAAVDVSATFNAFIAGLKNGTHQLIDSIQVDYNNTNVVQLQPFTNFFVGYKLMSKFSTDDLAKWGPITLFEPDTPNSYVYRAAAAVEGIGHTNNRVQKDPALALTARWAQAVPNNLADFNAGYLKRLQYTAQLNTGSAALPEMVSSAAFNNVGKNYYVVNGAGATASYQWNILATVPLKFLADFFEKIPLVKGGFMRLIINYNSSSFTTTTTGIAGAAHTATCSVPTMLSGRTNPIMVSTTGTTAGTGPFDTAVATMTFRCGVVNAGVATGATAQSSAILNSCRLYVPCYSLDPKHEEELISIRPVREVAYHDVYNFNITGIAAGSSFNNILTNGIVNPKYVVIIPSVNVASNALANLLTYQSPFDSAPGTTAPLGSIYNFNVQVGGRNIFQQNFNYDFENFNNEISRINAINGGETFGITSGLITADMWSNAYRYHVANISRREKSEDIVPKSITVLGTNNTAITMDYICFVVFERKIKINMLDGSLVRD